METTPGGEGKENEKGMRRESPLSNELEELIRKVIGAAIEVHRHLGPGFLESIYEKALCHELKLRDIPFERQQSIKVPFKDIEIAGQRVDLVVDNELIVELKTVNEIAPIIEAILISYLKAARKKAGLILNFKVRRMKDGIRRILL
jgi:GxxExxY protein